MASTFSDLKIQLMATGENTGTWGDVTNVNLGTALEEAITGSADVVFSSADVTLPFINTNETQLARNLRLNLTGTSGGARNLIVPAIEKVYIINNGLADTVTVKNAAGTGIAVPTGKTMYVFNDGTNVVDAITHLTSLTLGSPLPVASGGTGVTTSTGTGNVVLSTSPTLVTPALGTPASGDLANCTFPTLNQNTTGTATNATNVTGTTTASIPTTALGSGTADDTTFLRGDRTFATLTIPPASIPAGSVMVFVQTAAPTGWTKSTAHDNKALRVVTGTAETGGSVAFTTAFASTTAGGTVSNHTLSVAQLASHNHEIRPNQIGAGGGANFTTYTNSGINQGQKTFNTGSSGAHSHGFTGSTLDLAVQYVDVIIATKD